MLEVVEHPLFFQQALDKVEVGFAVLGDVGVMLERLAQAEFVPGKRGAQGKHLGDDILDRATLENARVEAVLQHGEPGVQRRRIAGHAAVAADAGKPREVACQVTRRGVCQLDFQNHVLAHHRLQLDAGVLAHQQQFKVVRAGQTFGPLEGLKQQLLFGVGEVLELEQAPILRGKHCGKVHQHVYLLENSGKLPPSLNHCARIR
ncbi:hypothetical protein D3C80_1292880 [compost metagenome]